jgi:TRAP-type C4-dicarboxylate transport system permease small subunit
VVGLVLVIGGCWGFAYCQHEKGHISVNIFIQKFPRKIRATLNSLSLTIGIVGFSLICWRMYLQSLKYFGMARGNTTDTLNWPYAPFMMFLAIACAAMVLILIKDLVHVIADEVKKK